MNNIETHIPNKISLSINQFTYDALMLHIDASNLYPELIPVFKALEYTVPIKRSRGIIRNITIPYECLIPFENYCLTYKKIYSDNKNHKAVGYVQIFVRYLRENINLYAYIALSSINHPKGIALHLFDTKEREFLGKDIWKTGEVDNYNSIKILRKDIPVLVERYNDYGRRVWPYIECPVWYLV